ncbi:MAG: cellulose biosynthesis cyclic di-GMP-binding regulatory protein BcsB [Pseudomonadota bacterium]
MTSIRTATPWALALVAMLSSAAQSAPSDSLYVDEQNGEYVLPFGWFNGGSRAPIELRGAESRRALTLPVAERLKIEEARLEMVYTQSISLLPRSQLAVTMDERIIAQLPFRPGQPDNAARMSIAPQAIKPGFRSIGLRAAQHYTNECEDPTAAELYTQIDASQSMLRIKTTRKPIEPSLARLSNIFDRKLWMDRYTLQLLTPKGGLGQSRELREAAVQVSQAIAATFEYLPVSVQLNELNPPPADATPDPRARFHGVQLPETSWDAVLIGTRDQLAPHLGQDILGRIKDGYVGVFRADQDPSRAILVVSGTTPAEVLEAATMLNLPGLALPERSDVSVAQLRADKAYRAIKPIPAEQGWTSFANLGFKSVTLKGMFPEPARLRFWAFREMFDPADQYIDLELSLAYGAGFDRKSGLNLLLNEQLIRTVPMQSPQGEQFSRYKVKLPIPALREGINELKLQPTMTGLDLGGACQPIFTENLLVSISDDSRIGLPDISEFMPQPNLALLAYNGLPYSRMADAQGVALLFTDHDPTTLSAGFSLMAKLRQISKTPAIALRVLDPNDARDNLNGLIVVGTDEALPANLRNDMETFLTKQRWQDLKLGSRTSTDLGEGVKRLAEHPLEPVVRLSSVEKIAGAELRLDGGLGGSAAAIQYRDAKGGYPVTILTASNGTRLQLGAQRLVEHSTWAGLAGAATLWSMDGEAIANAMPVKHSFIGEVPGKSKPDYFFSDHPWLVAVLALTLVLILATLSWLLLRQRAQKMMD